MIKSPATYKSSENIAADTSGQKKGPTVFKRLIGFFILLSTLCVLLIPQEAHTHPGKEASCTACHALVDPDASFSLFIDNVATTSIEVPNDGTASFEVDYFFSNAMDTANYEGTGVEIAVPSGWGVAAGTNAFSPPGWNAAWDLADGVGWSPVFDTSSQNPDEPDGYTVNYDTSPWDIGNRDAACDNGGSCSSGTDQDGTIDTMGSDAIVSIPLGTPAGAYTVRVQGIGHHNNVKSYVSDLITVTVTADVTSAVGEISPNNVVVNSLGNVFTYDILPTITGIATGVDRVEITAPTGHSNLNVTGTSVGGSGLTANCPTPGAGQYCATIAAPVMTIDLGTKVTTSLTNIQITFTADAPASTGDDAFPSTVDDTGTARPPVTVTVGNADGNPGDNNSQTVTVVGNSLTWVGGNDNDFNNSLNWSPNRIPSLSDECIINSYTTFQPVIQSNAFCGSITLGTGGTVISLTFSGNNNLDVSGDVVIGANGRLTPSGTPQGYFSVGGNWSDDIGTTNFTSSNLQLDYRFDGTAEPIFTDESFYDVQIMGDITLNSSLTIANSLTISNGGELFQGANTIFMYGSIFAINGTYTHDCNSVLEINSTLSLQSGKRYPVVIVNSSADVSGANPAYVDCDLTLQSGSTFSPGMHLHVKGDWINNGATLNLGTSMVHMNGLNAQIRGTAQTDFYDLVIGEVPGSVTTPLYDISMGRDLTVSAGATLNITAGNNISVVRNTSISGDINLSGTTTWSQGGGNNVGITVNFGGLLSAQGTDSSNRVTFTRSDTNYYQMIVDGGIDFQYVNLFYTQDASAGSGIAINSDLGETMNFDYVAINNTADANGATMMYWNSNRTLNTTGVTFDSSTYVGNDYNIEAVQGTITFNNFGGNFSGELKDNDNGGVANWNTAITTIGDGVVPVSRGVWAGGRFFGVDAFTLQTDSGTDNLTALTITFSGTNVSDIGGSGVMLWRDDGGINDQWDTTDTLISTAAAFVGNTASFSGFTEPINTTSTQYIITYNIAVTAGVGNWLQGAVTAAMVSNGLVNNDNVDATLTVEADGVHETSVYKTVFSPGSLEELYLKGTSSPLADTLDSMSLGSLYATGLTPGSLLISSDPDTTVTTSVDNTAVKHVQMSGRLMQALGNQYGTVDTDIAFYEDRIVFDMTITLTSNPPGANDWMFMSYGQWGSAMSNNFKYSSNLGPFTDRVASWTSSGETDPISYQTFFELGAIDGLVNATMQNISAFDPAGFKNIDNGGGSSFDVAFQRTVGVSTYHTSVQYSFDTTTGGLNATLAEERQNDFFTPAALNFVIAGGDGSPDGDGYVEERGAYTLNDGDADDHVRFQLEPTTTHHAPVFEITGWNSGAPAYIDVGGVLKASGTHYNAAVTGGVLYLQYLSNISANTIIEIPSTCPGFVVTTTGDTGMGSLRACIDLANSNSGQDSITFDGGVFNPGTINVGAVLPDLNDVGNAGTIINGGSAANVIIDGGNGTYAGLVIASNSNELRNVTIQNFDSIGIDLANNADSNIIADNVIKNNSSHGIDLAGFNDSNQILGNTIEYNSKTAEWSDGIYWGYTVGPSNSNTVNGNTIRFNGAHGIIINASTGNVISNNFIHDNGTEQSDAIGVRIRRDSDGNTFMNNDIYNNANNGIQIHEGSGGNTIEGNRVYNNGATGAGKYGILVHEANSDGNTIQRNTVRDNGGTGIVLSLGSNNKVYNNTIHSNGGAKTEDGIGIAAATAGTIIKNNVITSNARYGVNDGDSGSSTVADYNDFFGNVTATCNYDCLTGLLNITTDPQYNDEPGDNYTLTECTSPAINMACDLGAAGDDTFCDSASDGAQPDLVNGTGAPLSTKFNNNAPDMGAYETSDCDPGLTIVKQVWEEGGTAPLGNPTAPVGATLVFLIYVKNTTAGPVSDLRINDDLDEAGFEYVTGSMVRTDAGSPPVDTATDKQIFDATASGTGTDIMDPMDGDVASAQDTGDLGIDVDKITIGDVAAQPNAPLSMGAHETFALRFKVKVK